MPRRLRAPSWFDLRLILGIGLVLASILIGAVVMARADSTRPLLAVVRDLDSGTVLTANDIRTTRVRLNEGARTSTSGREPPSPARCSCARCDRVSCCPEGRWAILIRTT